MNEKSESINKSTHYDRLIQIACDAVQKAQEESRRMGVPNVYSINGKLLYEWPNGELRLAPPPGKGE
jgi:hypothetical protein